MLVLYIIIIMFTNTLNAHKKNIDPIYINRLTILTFLVSILLSFNVLYFQSIGKGVTLYNDLFQITLQSQIIEMFLLLLGIFILSGWPLRFWSVSSSPTTAPAQLRTAGIKDNANKNMTNNVTLFKKESVDNDRINSPSFLNESPTAMRIINKNSNNVSIYKSDQYSLIAIFSILGGSLLMSSFDLLSMYLSIELQSFSLYILATLNKDRLTATSAGLKYFLLGGLSSCFILLGSGIIYSYTGLTQFESINSLVSIPSSYIDIMDNSFSSIKGVGENSINKAFTIGLIILMVGFLFKISAAPFYQWAPDVYEGTPTIVTVWLTIIAKLTIFVFIQGFIDFPLPNTTFSPLSSAIISLNETNLLDTFLNMKGNLDETGYIIKNLLLISSLLSLVIGTIAGLSQIKIKRLLAFSSVSHVGFLLLALGIFSPKSMDAFIFYLIQYSITSLNIFMIVLAFGYVINKYLMPYVPLHYYSSILPISKEVVKEETIGIENRISPLALTTSNKTLDLNRPQLKEGSIETDLNFLYELKGQVLNNPILSFSFAICLLSMAGIPPLIGFFSKQFVLLSSIENGNIFLSVIAILMSVISASYYLKLIKLTFFHSLNPNSAILHSNLGKGSPVSRMYEGWQLGISQIHSLIISLLTFIILLFFLNPSILINGTLLISLTFFNL